MLLSRFGRTVQNRRGYFGSSISSIERTKTVSHFRDVAIRYSSESSRLHEQPLVRTGVSPPIYREGSHYCHYPALITSVPTIGNIAGYERVFVEKSNSGRCFTNDYFVDVPFGLFPGETFRALILADEYLITCPNITRSGERIVVTLVSH